MKPVKYKKKKERKKSGQETKGNRNNTVVIITRWSHTHTAAGLSVAMSFRFVASTFFPSSPTTTISTFNTFLTFFFSFVFLMKKKN